MMTHREDMTRKNEQKCQLLDSNRDATVYRKGERGSKRKVGFC